ncbi:hypothetical protein J4446_03335 [Candidatus Woesearchaeota archaeon]|nr:hypothetical protein [Candidatus Woesearchaeota archaeon]
MENQQLLQEVREIKKDIKIIMENMPDKDMFLTSEEKGLLEESYNNERNKKLVSGKILRKN